MQHWNRYWDGSRDEFSDRGITSELLESIDYLFDCHRIVDLGCGIGAAVKFFLDRGHEAVGVTYQEREVEYARLHLGLELVLADMHDLPLAGESFDGFLMWDSLEHCVAPYVALCEARRVVKSGGKGLIYIPDQTWQDCHYHQIVLTQHQMRHLLNLAGFHLAGLTDKGNEAAAYQVIKLAK